MDDYDFLTILSGILFDSPVEDAADIIAKNPSIPNCLSTSEFSEKLRFVFLIKKRIVAFRWRRFFDTCYKKMLRSHEEYLTCIMFACISEQKCHNNVFDCFISVCAVLKFLCDDTFQRTRVSFSVFNSDIIYMFYSAQLENTISRCGGLQKIVEYIRNHRYLKWKVNDSLISPDDRRVIFKGMNLKELIEKEMKKHNVIEKVISADEAANDELSVDLAKTVLAVTLIDPPEIPDIQILFKHMFAYKQKELENKYGKNQAETFGASSTDLPENLNSSSEFKTTIAKDCQDDIEQHEKVIQAVTVRNNSKNSGPKDANIRIQKEADEVLKRLNDNIRSLMKVLD